MSTQTLRTMRVRRARVLLWPGVMTAAMLVVLLGLGTWQLERLAWKEAILGRIAQAEAAPAEPLGANPERFAKVRAAGRFIARREAFYGVSVRDTAAGPRMGADLIAPLRRTDGTVVLVDRGWVPTNPAGPVPTPDGDVTVEGYIRPAEHPGFISATDDLARRQFFTLDPEAIGVALGLARVDDFTLIALGRGAPGVYPIPATHLPRPPNNHFQYALTWYGLAGALVVIFISWARKRLSENERL